MLGCLKLPCNSFSQVRMIEPTRSSIPLSFGNNKSLRTGLNAMTCCSFEHSMEM